MSCGASRSKVRKLVYEEHTEYVALEVNSSKSGWPTMYKTLQVVLLHVFNITFYAYYWLSNFVIIIHDVITCTESPFQDGNDGGMVEVIKRMDRK